MTSAKNADDDKRIRFDGTVNLGHLITFAGFLVTCGAMWSAMDKRVTVLEDARIQQRQIDSRQDADAAESKRSVREDLQLISAKLDRLIERK